jgi:hypothetical protein
MNVSSSILLPQRSLVAWVVAYLVPPLFFTVLEIGDFVGLRLGGGTGWLVYSVPLLSLLSCWAVVLASSARLGTKAGWLLFSVFAQLLEFIICVLIFGALGFARHGLEGIQ